jgi:hypothetical protein
MLCIMLIVIILNVMLINGYAECHYDECLYDECGGTNFTGLFSVWESIECAKTVPGHSA